MALNFPANPQDGDTYEGYIYSSDVSAWRLISSVYATESYVDTRVNGKISNLEKGSPLGVATLDSSGNVEPSQLQNIIDGAPNTLDSFGKVAGQFNRFTTAQWATNTDILQYASVNVEITEEGIAKVKIGDGTNTWADLGYVLNDEYLQAELEDINQEITNLNVYKADLLDPVFSNDVQILGSLTVEASTTLSNVDNIAGVSEAEIVTLSGVTSNIQDQLDSKADASTVQGFAPINSPTFTGNVVLPYNTSIGNLTSAELNALDGVSTDLTVQYQLDELNEDVGIIETNVTDLSNTKAPINSPTFTGTVSGITKAMVGLSNVNNTSDLAKPISTATQSALDQKANISGQVFTGDVEAPNLTITGDLYVAGTTTTINTTDYSVRDNMIYLNQAGLFNITNVVGDGTNIVYTTSQPHDYGVGDYVFVTGVVPTSFNISPVPGKVIAAITENTFTVEGTSTETYVSGGAARGKSAANPDLGFAAGYNDGTYHHAGFFRDASDGTWKVFDGYDPEPDEAVFIDTSDPSFALADFQADAVKANTLVFNDGSVQTKAGVPSQTSFVYRTASYTLDSLALADNVIEVNSTSPTTITIPLDSAINYPIGTSLDILQTNTGQVTIAATGGVTLNGTPGFKLRTQWSSATILKRAANTWIVYGDLTL